MERATIGVRLHVMISVQSILAIAVNGSAATRISPFPLGKKYYADRNSPPQENDIPRDVRALGWVAAFFLKEATNIAETRPPGQGAANMLTLPSLRANGPLYQVRPEPLWSAPHDGADSAAPRRFAQRRELVWGNRNALKD